MKGGARQGAGRKRGSKNKDTVAREAALQRAVQLVGETVANAFEGDSHALLMAVYRNQDLPLNLRIDAAKAAIGYEKPKLAAVQHSGDADNPLEQNTRVELVVIDAGNDQGLRSPKAGAFTQPRPI